MSLPPYPTYTTGKMSHVSELPAHWSPSQLRYLFSFRKGLNITKDNLADDGIPCLNYGEVHSKYPVTFSPIYNALRCVSEEYLETNLSSLLSEGDLVFADTSEDLKGSGNFSQLCADEPVFAGYHTIIVKPTDRRAYKFYAYLFDSMEFRTQIQLSVKGVKVFSITQEILRNAGVWMPTIEERKQIAGFLDHETSKIDKLIERQKQLIELLKEKRQAVISHVVTKGLDPSVRMKDSGVEWLGEVPAHWDIRKLKNLVSVRGGSTPSKEIEQYWDGEIPWVSPKDMKIDRINNSIDHVSDSALQETGLSSIKKDAVLIVVRGMILLHSVPVAITDVDVTINQDMKAMMPTGELSSEYLLLLLKGVRDTVFQYIDSSAHGTRKLEWERFELIELPIPSHAEQSRIVRFIENQTRTIDLLAERVTSSITFMKERRSALISAAVTGKIDVRDWQPPQEKAN